MDLLVVSLPLDRVVSGSSAGIEGLHLTLAPPYIFPKFDGFIGKGRIAFDQAGTEPGSKLIGRVYGTLFGDRIDAQEGERDYEENSKTIDFWLVRQPAFLEAPEQADVNAQLPKPAAAVISTDATFITFLKLRLEYVVEGRFESPSASIPEALASNAA